MKKLTLFILGSFLMFHHNMQAQGGGSFLRASGTYSDKPVRDELKKGNRTVALNGLGNYFNSIIRKGGSWSLTPQAGYFLANNWVGGIQLSVARDWSRKKDGNTLPAIAPDHTLFSLAPEIYSRYYVTSFRVKPFLQLSTGYNFQWGDINSVSGESISSSSQNYILGGAIGINFLLNKNIAIETLYNHRFATESKLADPNKDLKIRVGISVFIR